MGHSDEWTFADYFKYEKEIYRAIISAAVLCQWIAEHDTPPTDGEAEELAREIDADCVKHGAKFFRLAVRGMAGRPVTPGRLRIVRLPLCTAAFLYPKHHHNLNLWR
mgnify:CR=1 FL=1